MAIELILILIFFLGNINTGLHSREEQGQLTYKSNATLNGKWANDAPLTATKVFDSKSPE